MKPTTSSAFRRRAGLHQRGRSARNTRPAAALVEPATERDLAALVARGVREDRARQILLDLPMSRPSWTRSNGAIAEIARKQRTREPISNPPGFYVYLLRSNYPVPPDFETSRKRAIAGAGPAARHGRARAPGPGRTGQVRARERYEAWVIEETERYLKTRVPRGDAGTPAARAHEANPAGRAPIPWPETTLREFAWRKLREEVAAETGTAELRGVPAARRRQAVLIRFTSRYEGARAARCAPFRYT